jgi:MoaA/NifB/PqqE/SkfB family radical SAM enzyme
LKAVDRAETAEFDGIVEDTVQRFAADFESKFISESPEKLRRLPRYYAALNGLSEFPTTVCNAPWVSSVVEADGTVRPCFFHAPFGNVHDNTLEDILNSPSAVEFRRTLDVHENPICKTCVCTLSMGRRTPA